MDTLKLRGFDTFWPAAVTLAAAASSLLSFRRPDARPLILRPGGMGDLILLCVAAEELGCDLKNFFWVIERRSAPWARNLGLDHLCYDEGLIAQHWRIAGRFPLAINSEQLYGLSQATARLACSRGAILTCFATNRGASRAGQKVPYDPDLMNEAVSFQRLLAASLGRADIAARTEPIVRSRKVKASEKPIVGIAGLQSESRSFSDGQWENFIRSWIGHEPFWIASSETDRPVARRLSQKFHHQAEVFEGGFNSLCHLISQSSQVLTVDGGFLHIASYYGVPVTGVFTSGRDRKWAALASGSRVVRRRDLECQPCTWFGAVPPCKHDFACKDLVFDRDVRDTSFTVEIE